MTSKRWGGRFARETDPRVEAYTASVSFDWRLYREDIAASIAHARMLARQGIIPAADADAVVLGLEEVQREIEAGEFVFRPELEDLHGNIEARLAEKVGPETAGKLHTARSRNDQVATDLRLYVKARLAEATEAVDALQAALLDLAGAHPDLLMPGYTHLQRAQAVLFAHHLLAYVEMLERDRGRFQNCLQRTDVLPLGSGALAGVPYPIDRLFVAQELGFARVSENSIDAVSDRDFVAEFQAAAALCMAHLSRLAEEVVLWSTAEFGFLELSDAFTTGSSIMPQKKNPDVAELARGRTGRVYGNLVSILTVLKGLPLAYNRDLQEDKEPLFDTVDTLLSTLRVFAAMLAEAQVRADRMTAAASDASLVATDLADYLVRQGLPFQEAHEAVGRLVRYAQERGKAFSELTIGEYRSVSSLFQEDVRRLDAWASVQGREVPGGTGPQQVAEALRRARQRLKERRPGT